MYETVYAHILKHLLLFKAVLIVLMMDAQDTASCILNTQPGTDNLIVNVYDSAFVEPLVTVTDNSSSYVTINRKGNFDITITGTYIITYTGTDGVGNICSYVRIIKVVDRTKPTIVCQPVTITRWT